MKTSSFRIVLSLLLAFFFSCQEEENPNPGPGPNPPVASKPLAKTVDVNVILPAGVSLDLSKTKLSTGLMDFNVDGSGKSKAILPDGIIRMAYLQNENNQILMMGIIHDQNKTLSAATTAEALFYLGTGIYYLPEKVIKDYLQTGSTLPGMQEFKDKIEQGIKGDVAYIAKGTYEEPLGQYLSEFSQSVDPIDIRARQINVDPTGFQSGVQIFENDALTVKLANTYRRRAHAFFYKTAYKSKGAEKETVVLSAIGKGEKAMTTKEIEPTSAFDGLIGSLAEQIQNKGIEKARKETDPIPLPLGDNEDEATYKVRVVGPGFIPIGSSEMTEEEKKMYDLLLMKQLTLDFVMPMLAEVFSEIKDMKDPDLGLEAIQLVFSKSPELWAFVEKGDWKTATFEVVKYLFLDIAGQEILKQKIIAPIVNKYKNSSDPSWIDIDRDYTNAKAVEKYAGLVKSVELTGKLLDMTKLLVELGMSNQMDVFTAKSIRSEIKIDPKESTVVPFVNLALKAEAKTQLSQGQTFVYKWSTTGKYGIISSGNLKGPMIETSSATVNFRSEKNVNELEDNNFETVKVEVYIKSGTTMTLVGDGKATVNVVKRKLLMKPDGITLDGKSKESMALYLERADNINDIISTPTLEYKVEWTLSGSCGMIDGVTKTATTRGNKIVYQALEDELKECIETVTAHVYFREPGKEWVLREIVTGKVKVVNDPKKIVLNVPLITRDWNISQGGGYTAGVNLIAQVPIHEKAVKYSVKIYGLKQGNISPTKIWSWQAGKEAPSDWLYPPGGQTGIVGNQYHLSVSSTWCSGQPVDCNPNIPGYHAFYKGWGGYANIEIEITD